MASSLASLPRRAAAAAPAERPSPVRGPAHPSLPADDFRALFRGHPGGVALITGDDGSRPVALTATSVSSVSADPPLLVFSVSALSSAAPTLARARTVVVHLLDADDLAVATLGATSGIDRFADTTRWARVDTGEPVFHGVRAWVRCAVIGRMPVGASTVIAAHALDAHFREGVDPDGEIDATARGGALVHHNRTWHRVGPHTRVDADR